ncbi:MAG: hypothetical protein COA96_02330 [SAR86 cluster bacterium]|uniref:Cytochrome C Planctomycete-type domain-containing protein n=1 Tax=SAR86 cluster bacterium TaxID=2030880 RepID=A0A2A5B923_9GAMM|nr:MAG: hypothetical protein COA96_02330 [SAR86 cluster bacterium]
MSPRNWRVPLAASVVVFLLFACSDTDPVFHDEVRPLRLSDWNLYSLTSDELLPSEASLVFRPANQLFTDYAHKLRTLWIPDNAQAHLLDGEIDYPVGTIISKTFYYPLDTSGDMVKTSDPGLKRIDLGQNQLIETRLLVRKESGWDAFPYVWNDEQSEAFLRVAGASKAIQLHDIESPIENTNLEFAYFVPNENQCAGCHITSHPDGDMQPLGAIASQLSASFSPTEGQLDIQTEILRKRGWLDEIPARMESKPWNDESQPLEDRALAYLNIHCGHCHNPNGAADTSGLILDGSHSIDVSTGICKPPVAAGGGTGNLLYGIVPGEPEQSILVYRMQSTAPDEMMPELGRSLVHTEGVDLIRRWISSMPGSC